MATTSGFKVACPSCEAMVPIKDQSLVGKKVDCPKCKYRFVVEAPDDEDGGEDDGDKPAKKAVGASTKKASAAAAGKVNGEARAKPKPLPRRDEDEEDDDAPKKKKSNTTLLIGGGIGVLAVGLVIAGFSMGWFGGGGDEKKSSNPTTTTQGKGGSTTPSTPTNTGGNTEGSEPKEDAPKDPPSVALGDVTNLLPDSSQMVIAIEGKKFLATPAGITLFDANGGTDTLIKSRLGFGSREVQKVLFASNMLDGWTWTVVQTKVPLKIEAVKAAIDPEAKGKKVKGRDYYATQSNEVFKMLGAYLTEQLKRLGTPFPESPAGRNMAFSLLDPHTLIIADVLQMERFLKQDARWKEQSVVTPPAADPNAAPMGGGPPMGGGFPMPGGGRPGSGGPPMPSGVPVPPGGGRPGGGPPGAANTALFTNNPSYRTVDPQLKAMLNRLDEKNEAVLLMAVKVSTNQLGPDVLDFVKQRGATGIAAAVLKITGSTVVGACVTQCLPGKFQLTAGVELAKDVDAKELAQPLTQFILPGLAAEISNALNIPVEVRDPNNPGGTGGTSPPGGFNPGPMGPGSMPPRPGGGPGGRPPGPGGQQSAPSPNSAEFQQPGSRPPMGPMGGGSFPPMGGTTNANDPNRPKIDSFVSVSTSDNVVLLTVELDWKVVYNSRVIPPVRSFVESQRGRVTMLAGRSHWLNLGPGTQKVQARQAYPRAALTREPNAARFGLPFQPDQRLSWMVEMLPFLGYERLYNAVDRDKSWSHEFNLAAGENWVPEFLNPSAPAATWRADLPSLRGRQLGATHFVGLSGIGLDSADYPDDEQHAKQLGIFGYDRETRLEDVAKGDGLSNTIFMIQVSPDIQRPWIRGGGSTVQGVPEKDSIKPFVGQQLGRNMQFGTHIVMADGSVRYLSGTTSDEVFKALATYKGGEKIDNLDIIAPRVDGKLAPEKKDPNSPSGISDVAATWPPQFIPEMLGTVSFPNKPERFTVVIEEKDPQNPNGKPKLKPTGDYWYATVIGTAKWVVQVEIPRAALTDGGEADLERIMNGQMVRYSEWEIRSPANVKKTTVNGTAARSFETSNANGRFRHLLFVYNRHIVELYTSIERVSAADQKRFFDSVKIEDPQLGKWQNATVAFGGVQLSADFPGKALRANGDDDPTQRHWTVNFPSGARFFVAFRSDTALPDVDRGGRAADARIDEIKTKNPKLEVYDIKRADASGIEGRELKTRTPQESTHDRFWVVGGMAITVRIYEPEKVKAGDVKRFFDSIKITRGGAPAEPKDAEPKVEPKGSSGKLTLKDLNGKWQVVFAAKGGEERSREEALAANVVVDYADDTYAVTAAGKLVEKGKMTINSEKSPAWIDLDIQEGKDKGKKQVGIIRIEGGKLETCIAPPGGERPKDFASAKGSQDGYSRLERFQR